MGILPATSFSTLLLMLAREKFNARAISDAAGGEEFAFLIREQIEPDKDLAGMGRRQANQLGSIASSPENLRQTIETTPIALPATSTPDGAVTISVTVSIGVLVGIGSPRDYGEAERHLEQKFQVVDRNLYLGEGSGRNRVVISESLTASPNEGTA